MSKLIDLSNQQFGFWTVQTRTNNAKNGQVQWLCKCDCGQIKVVTANSLRSGNSTSCGCNHNPNLSNLIFGQLKVLKKQPSKNSRRYWECQCACGNFITVSTYKLRSDAIKSCGCKVLFENVQVTVNIGKKFNGFLESIVTNFLTAEKMIVDSRTLSSITGPILMARGLKLIQEQISILSILNTELQDSIDVLSELKIQSYESSIIEQAIKDSCTLLKQFNHLVH